MADPRVFGGGPRPGTRACWALVLVALLAAVAFHGGRRAFIRAWFRDGPPGPAPRLAPAPAEDPVRSPADRVRVVLIDGLSESVAATLPAMGALCARGIALRVDAGFPTVSLPVQHVLWTGRTQQQSGVWYRTTPLSRPPAGSLPAAVPGAVAVAESHRSIAGSFGFERVLPEAGDRFDDARAFEAAAVRAVASAAPLVFVHVLRVDAAGHAAGRASRRYGEAARSADALLGRLQAAAPGARFFVLADHGHRAEGGHGGAEPSIRIVRACVAGPEVAPHDGTNEPPVHMVDLAAELAAAVGHARASGAVGRRLPAARRAPSPGATLPRASSARIAAAALVAAAGVAGAVVLGAGRQVAISVWFVLALAAFAARYGAPSLSVPAVYPPVGRDAAVAMTPGFLLLAAWAARRGARGRVAPVRTWAAAFSVPAGLVAAAFVACAGRPPLLPYATATVSVGLLALAFGHAAAALGFAAGCLIAARRRPGVDDGPSARPRRPCAGRSPAAGGPVS